MKFPNYDESCHDKYTEIVYISAHPQGWGEFANYTNQRAGKRLSQLSRTETQYNFSGSKKDNL